MPEDLLTRLRARGWKLTAQRRAVAQVFVGEHVHLTPEVVLDRARQILPEVSRATVYNTLRALVSEGEVREVITDEGPVRYDPNVGEHHHFVCRRCGSLYDVNPTGVPQLELAADASVWHEIDDVEVVFRGVCARCVGAPAVDA